MKVIYFTISIIRNYCWWRIPNILGSFPLLISDSVIISLISNINISTTVNAA